MEAMDLGHKFRGARAVLGLASLKVFSEPLSGMNFNAPYYQKLFENYGFQILL